MLRAIFLSLGLLALTACGRSDLEEPPVDLGNFRLGLNIAVADNAEKVPISRTATPDEWEEAMRKAVDDRFGRYRGSKLYNIGISVDGYALAPPGIPVIAAPKSVLVITANVWDDAAQQKLNTEGRQITVWEDAGANILGSGLIRGRDRQMERLAYNAAKKVEEWFQQNPDWFDIPQNAVPAPADMAEDTLN
ncbi:hypothetical protein [Falsirhodobacter algicola]|uniref:Uncharacterized protein n=1 Tax=Falsirhodobacter algicola TaxID=2692330 RepID=A0A8J8MTP1_9RHOB|nr:hypothetical protein [Falsirhodobacter algicola]QUS36541.1 hypothetical protein GR316_09870 [Falsirhodobacter algicola]